jgi:hypothetical protein
MAPPLQCRFDFRDSRLGHTRVAVIGKETDLEQAKRLALEPAFLVSSA